MRKYRDRMFKEKEWLFDQLEREHRRQLIKWGIQECTAFEWLAFTTEELGELAEAISEHHYRKSPKEKVVAEAFQVATLALKIAEMFNHQEE